MSARKIVKRKLSAVLIAALGAIAVGAFAAPASAIAAPAWSLEVTQLPSPFETGDIGRYALKVTNTGNTSGTVSEAKITAPPGMKIVNATSELFAGQFPVWSCSVEPDQQSASCGSFFPQAPGMATCANAANPARICRVLFVVEPEGSVTPGTVLTPEFEACSATAVPTCATATHPTEFSAPQGLRVPLFDGLVLKEDESVATQAGSHPFTAATELEINQRVASSGQVYAWEMAKDIIVDLPPGLVGNPNPNVVGNCTAAQLTASLQSECPPESRIGTIRVGASEGSLSGTPFFLSRPVFNLERAPGQTGTLGFNFSGVGSLINVRIRSGTDYGLRTEVANTAGILPLVNVRLTLWGVPADPGHNAERGGPSNMKELPFLSLPTRCTGEPDETRGAVTTWEGGEADASFLSRDNEPDPGPAVTEGCNILEFKPSLEARPTTNVADTPTGVAMDLTVPQNEDPLGTATAHMKDTVIEFPKGLLLNPSSANGLGSCSPEQAGLTSAVDELPVTFTPGPAECPDSSKLAKAEIITELLDRPLPGALYLATPHDNPFDSLLAVYLMMHDPVNGVVIKSPGEVELDPVTGQMTTAFRENPQLPFESLKIDFFSGSSAVFRTPSSCGTYTTKSTITPWSAPESGPSPTPSDSFAIINPAVGQKSCASTDGGRPNAPRFEAGTDAPIAGTDSPLVVNLRREDGTQEFSSIKLTPPPGLIGKLAGIPACSEAALAAAEAKSGKGEQGNPSCPAASQIGTVFAAAGAGTAPYHAPGTAYLTAPYKGAPLGLAIITPVVAGPFDLGTIVTRVALHVDPVTAQITAVADPIPSALEGIQLDVKSISIRLDRPGFIRNPTSCNAMAFAGELTSVLGQTAPLSNRFQLGECGRLGFKPHLSLTLKGSTKRRGHPSLVAVLTNRPGDANIASVSVALPSNEQLDQKNIGTVCTRVQFAASACPAASVYGSATVSTPILDHELSGSVYLRSSDNKLPDLVPDLRGPASQPIRLEATGRTDTIKGGLRNSFEFVPDAPFRRLVLTLNGGKKGLLINSSSVCKVKRLRATVNFTAHNGLYTEAHPLLKTECAKKKQGKRSTRRRAERRSGR